jgi:hypothetical protein
METSAYDGAFALLLLLTADIGIWWKIRWGFSMDYENVQIGSIKRAFPNRKPYQIAKVLLGFCFIASFVVVMRVGASQNLGLALMSMAVLLLFCLASAWEGIKAFRYFAAHHLTPRPRGGYRGL